MLDAVPASSSTGLGEGYRGAAATIWPEDAGPLPTADAPALAMVLVPAAQDRPRVSAARRRARAARRRGDGGTASGAGGAAPTWVFPFDRPLPPGEGDNQALAVNTEDGSVRYDVTFALVWADEDTVVNRNEAYAFASCRDCRTVAVAFQVVLIVGLGRRGRAAEPGRRGQLRLPRVRHLRAGHPARGDRARRAGEGGMQELAAIWEELRAFGEQIEDVPLAELRDRLTDVRGPHPRRRP